MCALIIGEEQNLCTAQDIVLCSHVINILFTEHNCKSLCKTSDLS